MGKVRKKVVGGGQWHRHELWTLHDILKETATELIPKWQAKRRRFLAKYAFCREKIAPKTRILRKYQRDLKRYMEIY